jgi:uncharacterized LabA/DUF88 family protein
MPNVSIILDGDATRRLIKRKLGKNPTPAEIEAFCRSTLHHDQDPNLHETLKDVFYYDCAPFGETRPRPISGTDKDFTGEDVCGMANKFQIRLSQNPFFTLRRGYLSFDGWTTTEVAIKDLTATPRPLTDNDFEPILSQKQVDMKIALDVAKMAISHSVDRILMITCDSDFIPMIDFARSKGLEVDLILDNTSILKRRLKKAFNGLRYV